jgi:hypothetical protein
MRHRDSRKHDARGPHIPVASHEGPKIERDMTLKLDHLTIIAPSLAEGVNHVRSCVDIDVPYGGAHL